MLSKKSFSTVGQIFLEALVRRTSAGSAGNRSAVLSSAYYRSVSRASPVSGPYRRSIWSSRRICADSAVTSPPSILNEVFAFEINSPSTSAETVVIRATIGGFSGLSMVVVLLFNDADLRAALCAAGARAMAAPMADASVHSPASDGFGGIWEC